MATLESWLYHYGWKTLPEKPEDLKNMKHQQIIDISRFYIYSDTKEEVISEFLSNFSDQISDFIAFQYGILMLNLEHTTPSFFDDPDRLQLHYNSDFQKNTIKEVKDKELSIVKPDMIFSAKKNGEYANQTIRNMLGKVIHRVGILRFKAENIWLEDRPRLGGIRLTLNDRSDVYIGTELRNIEDHSYLSVLSPDQVNFSRIEEVIEV